MATKENFIVQVRRAKFEMWRSGLTFAVFEVVLEFSRSALVWECQPQVSLPSTERAT